MDEQSAFCAWEDCDQDAVPGDALCQGCREAQDADQRTFHAEAEAHKARACGGDCFWCIDERLSSIPVSEF